MGLRAPGGTALSGPQPSQQQRPCGMRVAAWGLAPVSGSGNAVPLASFPRQRAHWCRPQRSSTIAAAAGATFGELGVFSPSDHAPPGAGRLGEVTELTVVGPNSNLQLTLGRVLHGTFGKRNGTVILGASPVSLRRGVGNQKALNQPCQHVHDQGQQQDTELQVHEASEQQAASIEAATSSSSGSEPGASDRPKAVQAQQPSSSGMHHLSQSEKRQLTSQIVKCSTWQQLGTLVHMHSEQLDHMHVSAALVKLAKLAPDPSRTVNPQLPALATNLCKRIPDCMHLVDDRQTANMLWALAVLMPTLSAAAYGRKAQQKQQQKQQDGNTAAAAQSAAAGALPSPAAVAAVTVAQHQANQLSTKMQQFWRTASPQALSNAIWAMAVLDIRPSVTWFKGFATGSRQVLPSFRPQELSSMLWALATLRLWPGQAWLDACMSACTASLQKFGPQALANTLWALAKLKAPMPDSFLQQLASACLEQLQGSSAALRSAKRRGAPASVSGRAARAGASFSQQPEGAGKGGFHEQLTPRHLGMILWSLAVLRHRRASPAASVSQPKSKQPLLPTPAAVAARKAAQAPKPPAEPACNTPSSPWGSDLLAVRELVSAIAEHVQPLLPHLSLRTSAAIAWSLARADFVPPAAWQEGLMQAFVSRPQQLTVITLCQLLIALTRWSANPPAQWVHQLTAAAQSQGLTTALTLEQSSAILVSCARLGCRPAPGFTQWVLAAVTRHMARGRCSPAAAAQVVWAVGQLRLWPGASWMQALRGLLVCRGADGRARVVDISPADAARLLQGLARVPAWASGNGTSDGEAAVADGIAVLPSPLPSPPAPDASLQQRKAQQSGTQPQPQRQRGAREGTVGELPHGSAAGQSLAGSGHAGAEPTAVPPPAGVTQPPRTRSPVAYLPAPLIHGLMARATASASMLDTGHLAEMAWAATRLGHPPREQWLAAFSVYASGTFRKQLGARPALCLLAALAAAPRPILLPPPGSPGEAVLTVEGLAGCLVGKVLAGASSLDAQQDMGLLVAIMTGRVVPQHAQPTSSATPATSSAFSTPSTAPAASLQGPASNSSPGHVAAAADTPDPVADARGPALCIAAAAAVISGLPLLPARHLASLVALTAAVGFAPSPAWGAAVEAASHKALSATPSFHGLPSPARVCLMGSLLFSGHRPSQAWLDTWCRAVAAGARTLAPTQILAAVRLAGAAAPHGVVAALSAGDSASGGGPAVGAGSVAQDRALHLSASFLAAVDAAAVATCAPLLASLPAAPTAEQQQQQQQGDAAYPASPSSPTSSGGVAPDTSCLHAWGPGKLAMLAGHLHMLGHEVSEQLASVAELAVVAHTMGRVQPQPQQQQQQHGGRNSSVTGASPSSSSTPGDSREGSEDSGVVQLVSAALELAHLSPRRCGVACARSITLLLHHLVNDVPPKLVLQAILDAAAAPSSHLAGGARAPRPAPGPALTSSSQPSPASSEEATSPIARQKAQQRQEGRVRFRDPVEPFYAALSIHRATSSPLSPAPTSPAASAGAGARRTAAAGAASPGRTLCTLLEMLASWGVAPPERWLSGLVSGACTPARRPPASTSAAVAAGAASSGASGAGAGAAPALMVDGERKGFVLSGPHACAVLRTLALLRCKVSQESVERLLALLTPTVLQQCSPKQVAEVAWALGALQFRPTSTWWDAYESVLLAPSPTAAAAMALSAAAAAAAAASGSPAAAAASSASLAAAAAAAASAAGASSASAPALVAVMPGKQVCEVAWACAALRLPPSPTLLTCLASSAARQLPSLDPASLSNLLWSLYVLDDSGPGIVWMDMWLSEASSKMVAFEAQDLALAVSGLAAAQYRPKSDWLVRFMAQAKAKVAECRGVQLLRILCSLAELGCRPDAAWLEVFAEAARSPSVAREFDESACGQLVWAFDRLSGGELLPSAYIHPALLARLDLQGRPGVGGTPAAVARQLGGSRADGRRVKKGKGERVALSTRRAKLRV